MIRFSCASILDLIESSDENTVKQLLSEFSCPNNMEIESFARKNALEFSKRKITVTHLLLDSDAQVAFDIVADVQSQVGGRIIYLECDKTKEKLMSFYMNGHNRFIKFSERYDSKENITYNQLFRIL